jgi:hypothetical protein
MVRSWRTTTPTCPTPLMPLTPRTIRAGTDRSRCPATWSLNSTATCSR